MPGNCYSVEHTISSGHTSNFSCCGGDRSHVQWQCPTSSTCLSSFLLRVLLRNPRSLLSPHAGAAHTSGATPYRWRMRQVDEGSGLLLCTGFPEGLPFSEGSSKWAPVWFVIFLSLPHSPVPASWDHLPNTLPAPKSLSQALLLQKPKLKHVVSSLVGSWTEQLRLVMFAPQPRLHKLSCDLTASRPARSSSSRRKTPRLSRRNG